MTLSEFDDGKKTDFRATIAMVADVSTADVKIMKVESMDSISSDRRQLLLTGIRIDMSVKAADKNTADAMGAKLTVTAINTKLQEAGMPAATILEAPKTEISDEANGGSVLSVIIGAAAGGLSVLIGIACCFFRRYNHNSCGCQLWWTTTTTTTETEFPSLYSKRRQPDWELTRDKISSAGPIWP